LSLVFLAVTFLCDHPDIQAISFVGSDRAVSHHFLSIVASVVHTLIGKSLKVFTLGVETSKHLIILIIIVSGLSFNVFLKVILVAP